MSVVVLKDKYRYIVGCDTRISSCGFIIKRFKLGGFKLLNDYTQVVSRY